MDSRARPAYLIVMRKREFDPCLPTRGTKVPAGTEWIHEIKHDGYRLTVQREGKSVRLFTKNGHDWTQRFPLIAESALLNRTSSFVIDGEAVLLGVDGVSDFDGLHSRRHDGEIQLYAFDILSLEGEDLRALPLHLRKNNLARLLNRRPDGIFISQSNRAGSGRTCSARPANSASRVWSQSGGIGPTALGHQRTGLRSRTRSTRR